MPGPPPPPPGGPPPMMPPPPPAFSPAKKGGGADDRGALLKSIRQGTKLKKTVTNDKSGPYIPGKSGNNNTASTASSGSSLGIGSGGSGGSVAPSNGFVGGLGDIFAGGMPKLRATGKLGASNLNNSSINNNNGDSSNYRKKETATTPTASSPVSKNFTSIQSELKKQMASDNRNRGPPPPAPIRTVSEEVSNRGVSNMNSSNGHQHHHSQSSLNIITNALQVNSSTLHRKAKSNANLSSLDATDTAVNGFHPKAVINHGKPNLAPKPPLNGKPAAPPKKLVISTKPVSRAHSMKSPRSPSPRSPDSSHSKFGTVRNMSSMLDQAFGGSAPPRSRPALNGRPPAPPPSIPQMNNLKVNVKPPNHAPPPPPVAPPQPPSHAPPPPPHRTTQIMRPPPSIPAGSNNSNAPPPPPRHSSMRDSTQKKPFVDFDERFKNLFQPADRFPKPPPFRKCMKLYSNKHVGSKQQAPQPPALHTSRQWDPATAC